MMEVQEPPKQRLDKSKLFCRGGNKCKFFCSRANCENGGLLCSQQNCQCTVKYHPSCGFTVPVSIIEKVQSKRVSLPYDIEKALITLDNVYGESIEKLSKDRQQLLIWKEKFGLNIQQASFINYIQSGNFDDIKGDLMNKIKRNIQEKQHFEGLDQQWVNRAWKRKKQEFQKMFDKLAVFKFKEIKSFKHGEFDFDQQNKPTVAAILDQGKTLTMAQNGNGQRIAFLTPGFNDMSNSKYGHSVWAFKINRYASWVGLGLCHYNQIKNSGYQFINYAQLGHGNYIISMNSYCWSSSQADQNNRNQTFSFTTGDIINICYDFDNKKLKFWKSQLDKYTLNNVQEPQNNDFLVPCINVNGNGDSLTIVQPNSQIDWDSF